MKKAWYAKKWVQVFLHALAWMVIFSLPFLLRTTYNNSHQSHSPSQETGFLYFYIVTCIIWIGVFYLNAFVLIPSFLYRKKILAYIGLNVLVIAAIYLLHYIVFGLLIKTVPFIPLNFFVFNIFPYMFIMTASTAYQTLLDKQRTEKRAAERENEHLKTELFFLRSQVSPHFMFNVLNNMVALARKKSDLLEPSLIKLSSLLRYMLYETDEEKVPLDKEIEYLQSYIDLQQQRFGKNVTVNSCFAETDNSYEIEPMLLIPFVENAFKHGTGLIDDATIDIKLKAGNSKLEFIVKNRYKENEAEIKDKTKGIGLANVERRLNLLYENKHSLMIDKNNSWFTVTLNIELN